jgi:hypothetical protein
LHLPQYLSFVLTSQLHSDITSIGCHTNLWNFHQNKYHDWVERRSDGKLAPVENVMLLLVRVNRIFLREWDYMIALLLIYFTSFNDPFILLSTGTWCISLNPFNHSMLSDYELHEDCLYCYEGYR